jgi:hypothetical protein
MALITLRACSKNGCERSTPWYARGDGPTKLKKHPVPILNLLGLIEPHVPLSKYPSLLRCYSTSSESNESTRIEEPETPRESRQRSSVSDGNGRKKG